jgi:CRP/FNR family transcriptional regulator, cyclic AMP receptor protein
MARPPVSVTAETIGSIKLFACLERVAREKLANRCHGQRVAAGEVIVTQHDESCDVYLVVSGNLLVTVFSPAGKQVQFRDKGAGEVFGELAAIDEKPRSACVTATTDSIVATLSRNDFTTIVATYPAVGEQLLRNLAEEIRTLTTRVFEFTTLTVNNRVHAEILRLVRDSDVSDESAPVISPMPTHAKIAGRISTHREAVTKELSRMMDMGIVEKSGKSLIVRDLKRLEDLVNDPLADHRQ